MADLLFRIPEPRDDFREKSIEAIIECMRDKETYVEFPLLRKP